MNKSQRLISLLIALNSKKKFTLKQLAEKFGVSKRTILRDLQDLELIGVPLYAEYGVNGGYQVLKERTLPPISFTENEATALFFACQSLEHYNSLPFDAEINTALDKFLRSLPDDTKNRIERLKERLRFWVPTQKAEQPYLRVLLNAALDRTLIVAVYESERGVQNRSLLPLGLYTMNGLWYCPALDAESGRIRVFRTDRFTSAQPVANELIQLETVSNFQKDADFPIDRWLGPQDDEAQLELEVQLTRRGVLRCQSDVWLASGLRVMDDGTGLIVRNMNESYVAWTASFFLSLGSDALVIRPEAVRVRIRKIITELVPIYEEVKE